MKKQSFFIYVLGCIWIFSAILMADKPKNPKPPKPRPPYGWIKI